jgi:signal transduction histidine kinase/tetratricopeptide (TPR) repeat protein
MSRPAERYKLLERLGAGGIGVVHRALDRATGREVAMKIMPRPRGGTNLRDEFVALARLRHRNVVSVLDYGLTDAGQEYFTMELVLGPPLAEAAAVEGAVAPAAAGWPTFFALMDGVLDALAFVHARGMIHADIKPTNILIDGAALATEPAAAARLADFGLAAAIDDPAARAARGTIAYAAPEAWAGRADMRSDLYALGVVMYELVTGDRPFAGTSAREVLTAQQRGAPRDPRRDHPELPAALAELIVALCDPAPGARPQSADEVRTRLSEVARASGVTVPAPVISSHAAPAVLSGPMVGRDRELAELERAWRDARAGRGSAVLVIGEEGMGTSRLVSELALRVQLDGGTVHRASVAGGSGPWTGLDTLARALIATAHDGFLVDEPAAISRRRALAPLLSDRADTEIEAAGTRWALAEALSDAALAAARESSIVLIIDDAHAASAAAIDLLGYLGRAAHEAPLLVIVAGHRAETSGTDIAAKLETAIRGSARGQEIAMRPLERAAIAQLAANAIGPELGARVTDELLRACGGNPGHALRALGAMIGDGQIQRAHGAWRAEGELTVPMLPNALEAARVRFGQLAPMTRAVLRAAAPLGESFDRDLVCATLGIDVDGSDGVVEPVADQASQGVVAQSAAGHLRLAGPAGAVGGARDIDGGPDPDTKELVAAALAEAVTARILHADPARGTFHFAHPQLASHLADDAVEPTRREEMRRAAIELEARHRAGRLVPAAQLAHAHRAAGNTDAAFAWSSTAIDEAVAAGDLRGALARATEAWSLASSESAVALAERIGDLATGCGEVELALHHYQLASGLLPTASAGDRSGEAAEAHVRIALAIADIHRRRGAGDAAHRVLMQALAAARSGRLVRAEARCHLRIGWVLMSRSDYKAATEHALAGLMIARTAGDRATAAELGRLAAAVAIYQADTGRALELLDAALADAEASGDQRLRAGVLHELGRAAIHAGDYRRAVDALSLAVASATETGDVEQRAKSLNNLGVAYYYLGEWSQARPAWERFRGLCERMGDQSELQSALNNLASLYRELGMLADARVDLERAAAVSAATGNAHIAAMILANRGEVEARDGDLAGARERYERALVEFQRLGAREDMIETRRRIAELDLAVGRLDDALSRAIDTARDARDAGVKIEEGILHRVAASALRLQGDLDSARWFLAKGREIITSLGSRYDLGKIALEEAAIARAAGKAAEYDAQLREAEQIFEQLGARDFLERVRAERRSSREVPLSTDLGNQILHELVRSVGVVDVERLLEQVLDRILEVSGLERGFILLLDGDGRPRERLRRTRPGARTFDRGDVEFSGTIVRRVAASGQAVAVGDTSLDVDLREQRSVVSLGLRRIMCAPLRVGGRVIGIIYVDSGQADDDRGFGVGALESLATPLGLAIEHARLVNEEKRKAELMSILAHEIRNPLAGILGYSEMGAEMEASVEVREVLGRIRSDAERLRRLTDNVLELARHESGNVDWSMTAIDVGQLIDDVAANAKVVCDRKSVALVVDVHELDVAALGNADRVAQVLSNLIGNAVKFTPPGGTVTIVARRESVLSRDSNAPPIPATEIRAWVPGADDEPVGDFIRVDVKDTGPGMTPELRERLFEKFAQASGKKRSTGVGLGLYISREIVRRHSGAIWVESELGHGATFSFRLPAAI